MGNYYNDNDPFMCEWIENLIAAGELPRGVADGRSITEVLPDGLKAFTQCHFFAGTGGWSLALKWAGWLPGWPVWTGSCPCQPFSQAGKGKGKDDSRHLWPEFLRLITECHPATIFGEQVASKDGREWLAGVRTDLEALGYAVGAADLCAAGTGAPHIRQRLFWVADTNGRRESSLVGVYGGSGVGAAGTGGVADTQYNGGRLDEQKREEEGRTSDWGLGARTGGLGNADGSQPPESQEQPAWQKRQAAPRASWHDYRIIHCRDGKLRRVPDPESGIQPLAYGIPRKLGPPLAGMGQMGIRAARANRVGRLRGYGNAIVPQLAAEFVRAYLELNAVGKEE